MVSRGQAYSVLTATKEGSSSEDKRADGLAGKIFTGYQGWFRAPGDGSGLGFSHYEKNEVALQVPLDPEKWIDFKG